ncbi:type I-MYXAN CRISPR-associated protein Cas5/Cmx5/DevS [Desulfocurvibacter africanus]|uniref:type I-MYXAN CRISPR-associated protein Cas5/Cmx5/DevS n=1 Tax=Desulfocurvibacter africanus TaxID=873 RepID=UPI002FDB503D
METLCLRVDVPICSFRPNWSREYQDTTSCPPPATVYGMLLSLAGVDWQGKERYRGVKLALALEDMPELGRVFRKFRRVSQSNPNADPLTSRRPDYQELLLGLRLWLWLQDGEARESLIDLVKTALDPSRREGIARAGGLCLGESSHLVDWIGQDTPNAKGMFLAKDKAGVLSLPVWVRHPRDASGETILARFTMGQDKDLVQPPEGDVRWVSIGLAP